jgi:hypothetical protein
MEQEPRTQFSLEEITEALSGLEIDAKQIVLDALRKRGQDRLAERNEDAFRSSIIHFAAVYERATGENASDSNIEGWYEELLQQSEELLGLFANQDSVAEVECAVRDTAALTYAYLCIERDLYPLSADLLINAGSSPDDLLLKFKDGITAAHTAMDSDATELTSRIQSIDDLAHKLHPDYWVRIITPLGNRMRALLKQAGYQLPELDEDGKYGVDDELDI